MPNISRVKVRWSGWPGAPGVSVYYTTDPATFKPALDTWLGSNVGTIPNTVTMTSEASGDTIDPLDGSLQGAWASGAEVVHNGTNASRWSSVTGYSVRWDTGAILSGHRLRGRTYFVPAPSDVFGYDGYVTDAIKGDIDTNAATFITDTAGVFVIWNRPRKVSAKHPVARAGGFAAVTTGHCSKSPAMMSSRRD